MSILYKNDRPGAYPESWYAASAEIPEGRPSLEGDSRKDVAIVGAGFTGLCAAIELSKQGFSVVVLDAHRVGFGASGRNGGQVWSGFRQSQIWLENKLGDHVARAFWDMSEAAKDQVRRNVAGFAPEARYTPGLIAGTYDEAETREWREEVEFIERHYGYSDATILDRTGIQSIVKTERYIGGIFDKGAGHIHPLRYAFGLAKAAEDAGAQILELTEATGIEDGTPCRVVTPKGTITADHVILAGNGYMTDLVPEVAAQVMPINSFIGATEPLADPTAVLAKDVAVGDSKFVVNYFRLSEDGRLLFGGREAYSLGFPQDIGTALHRRMCSLFPQLQGARFTHVWGGTLGITMTRMPLVARVGRNVLNASGFSGQGVALSGFAGTVVAQAIAGQAGRFDLLSSVPMGRFPGGPGFRAPLLTLAMTWFSLRDRLGI